MTSESMSAAGSLRFRPQWAQTNMSTRNTRFISSAQEYLRRVSGCGRAGTSVHGSREGRRCPHSWS
jgi:hypothetical protein